MTCRGLGFIIAYTTISGVWREYVDEFLTASATMGDPSFYINFQWMKDAEQQHQIFNQGWAFETDSRRRGGLVARAKNATVIFQVQVGKKAVCRLGMLKSYENVGTIAVTIGGVTTKVNALWKRQYSVLDYAYFKKLPTTGAQEMKVVLLEASYFKLLRILCQ